MKMKAHHRKCFLFWALIRMIFTCIGICHAQYIPFRVQDSKLSATEGSCAEIRCNAEAPLSDRNAKWFWMKDAVWDQKERDYVNITYVYSTDQQDVSADFAARVKYIGTGPPWYGRQTCSIQICNLKKTDSGNYRFRFVGTGTHIYSTEDATLTVRENQCPMTFTGQPVVKEFQTISLSCSTLPSCPSYPQIQGLRAPESTTLQEYTNDKKISNATFEATWQDDGKEFRCQAPDNTDQHLVKKFTLTVEYAPKDVEATVNPTAIIEGQRVTLTCSAKGHPAPTFTWFKNETKQSNQEAQWAIPQVETWHGGSYHCEARNKHGAVKSQSVDIDVTYRPEVEIKRTSPVSEAKEGDEMILECQVKRSHPMPSTYRWYKDNKILDHSGPQYRKTIVQTDGGVYKCVAENTAGSSGFLNPILINVQYGPRKPSIHPIPNQVKVGGSLEIFCDTTAEPAPTFYTWYRHTRGTHANTSVYGSHTEKYLSLTGLKRGDEACYTCSATNIIKTGESSEEACVEVLYPPTNLQLLMDPEVQEHQLVNISCTVESWPPSQLTLRAERSSAPLPSPTLRSNVLNYTFTATPAHRGTYTCSASNSEGSSQATQWDLVVRYGPRDVKIQAPAGLTGNENSGLTLLCSASAYPEASFTWWKVAPRAPEELRRNRTLAFDSLRASDSGQYKCSASNDIGTRESELAEVKVKYAPKLTVISRVAEQQQPDGRSSVRLSCSSHCYPPVLHYSWFKRATDEPGDKGIRVYSYQNVTVYSDKPGYYYCKARNEMGERSSDSEPLFVEGGFMKALKYGLLFLFIVILLIIVIGIYRWRRSKPVQRSSKTTTLRFGFLSGNNARTRLREPAHNSHSGDEMSYSQPTPQHPHRRPNVAPASELIVYSRVNLPTTNPGTAAQKATRQGDSNTMEGSLQYASLQFDKRKKTQEPKAEDNVVYAKVAKRKVVENHGDDYTNVGGAPALRPNVYSWDSDTSEEETALNYAQVSFPAKAEHERTRKDSSSSEKEETNYSEVKF